MSLVSKLCSLFHAEHQPQDVGPSIQGRKSQQNVEASKVTGVVAQNIGHKAQVGGEKSRFFNS